MPYIQVEVDLDEFDLDDLLEEIEHRYNKNGVRGKSNKTQVDEFIKKMKIEIDEDLLIKSPSLLDAIKVELFTKNIQKISVNDLEKLING